MTKTPLDIAIEEGQRCLKAFPTIVLGSGSSIPAGLPSMSALAEYLKASIRDESLADDDKAVWAEFVKELATKDLESALQAVKLGEGLSDRVAECTWTLINEADTRLFDEVLGDRNRLPITRLYRHLFGSTNRTISVVTTNYDRVAEYAADTGGFCHHTGFSYGYLRQRQGGNRLSFTQENRQARTVDIWKVHGCLDWFTRLDDGQVISVASARKVPAGHRPSIVTPGIEKYERTHLEPFRSTIAGADGALAKAAAYLCVGFGFNDAHIQPKLLERWNRGDAFLVVLTKVLSDSVRRMLRSANGQNFLALEEAEDGTQMWSHQHPDGVSLEGVHLWRLSDFLDRTT